MVITSAALAAHSQLRGVRAARPITHNQWRKEMWRVHLMTLAVLAGLVTGGLAQAPSSPTCEALIKNPAAFVGKPVSFFGSMTGFDMKPINGKIDNVNAWRCRTQEGNDLPGALAFAAERVECHEKDLEGANDGDTHAGRCARTTAASASDRRKS
jgi:hypothetical protein